MSAVNDDIRIIAEIPVRDGLVTRLTEAYISNDDLFLRCHQDVDGNGPVDLYHVHLDEMIPLAHALFRAHGMLRPVTRTADVVTLFPAATKVIPIQSAQDIATGDRWPA